MTTDSRTAAELVKTVRSDIASPQTTTTETLNLLRAVLGLDLQLAAPTKTALAGTKAPSIRPPPKSRAKPAAKATKTATTASFIIHETPTAQPHPLELKERRKVATETFNTTLKTLNNAAKSKKQEEVASPQKPLSKARDELQPLKECLPNGKKSAGRTLKAPQEPTQISTTAKCAGAALDCLRELVEPGKDQSSVDVGLENGGLVLLDKLITLELQQEAEYQSRRLYDQYWKQRGSSKPTQPHPPLFSRLCMSSEHSASTFKFSASLQGQLLRLAILRGSTCVEESYTAALSPEYEGSPAWIILRGLKLGFIDDEAAGTQLRTLSLTLAKFHAVVVGKSANAALELEHLTLASTALEIKAVSWKHLGHQPEFSRELWMPFTKLVKNSMSRAKDQARAQEAVKQCLTKLRLTLSHLGFATDVPAALRQFCSVDEQVSQEAADNNCLEKRLGKLSADDSQRLLLGLQSCLVRTQQWTKQTLVTINAVDQCTEIVSSCETTVDDIDDALIAMAQLRKAIMSIVSDVGSLQKAKASKDAHHDLQIASIRLIYALLFYSCRSDTRASERMPTASSRKKSGTLLTYAKTMETIFELDKYPITRTVVLEDETHRALDECAAFAVRLNKRLECSDSNASLGSFLRSVPVRVSQAFWSRYLLYTEQNRPVSIKLDALNRSICAVSACNHEQQKQATVALKYEKVAALYIEQKLFSKALRSLELSIEAAIKQDVLKEATNTGLSNTTGRICRDPKSPLQSFAQIINSYVALSVTNNIPNARGTWFYDNTDLEGIQRAVLLEKQILAALDHTSAFLKQDQLTSMLQLWEQLSFESKYRVYQLRFISQTLHILEKTKSFPAMNVLGSLLPLQTPSLTVIPKDAHAATLGPLLMALVSVQWCFATGTMNEEHLISSVGCIGKAVSDQAHSQTLDRVPDPQILLANVKALADYAGVLGNSAAQVEANQTWMQLLEQRTTVDSERKLACLLTTAAASLELHQTIDAGKRLVAAEQLVKSGSLEEVQWQLAYAAYHLAIGNFKRSKDLIVSSRCLFEAGSSLASPRDRLGREISLCQAAYLASRLALEEGDITNASRLARQAVKLSSGLWSSLERSLSSSASPGLEGNDSSLNNLTQDLGNLSLVETQNPQSPINFHGTKYWPALSMHRTHLRHAASLSAHNGLYQDAVFFAQQAAKVTAWTGGASLRLCVGSELALIYANASETQSALTLLAVDTHEPNVRYTTVNFAEASLRVGNVERAKLVLERMQEHDSGQSSNVKVAARNNQPPKSTVAKRGKTTSKVVGKGAQKVSAILNETPKVSTLSVCPNNRLLQARMAALTDEMYLQGVVERPSSLADTEIARWTPLEILSRATVSVHDAMNHFASDPANNAIAETALALPVRYRTTRKSGQMSLLLESPAKSTGHTRTPSDIPENGDTLLRQAYEWLRAVEDKPLSALPSARVEQLHKVLSQVILLSTALNHPLSYSPLGVVLQSLRSRDAAMQRERCAILAESRTTTREQIQTWPSVSDTEVFQQNYDELMHQLPSSWAIISIGLSYDRKELLLSKIIAGRTPFLMRVPLERPGLEGDEPCEFTLDYAKDELRDIISKANESSHDSRGQGDKQARKAWYGEREHLDKRLELLLANIENIWLGGFRGLLSPNCADEALLARFGESLTQAFENHLPSRQKKAKTKRKVELHAHVLELFTSVVFAEGDTDFEDSVTDLLYFVVDILQFNGEPNAFDEIDFDALLLDTIDALRGYHAASTSSPARHAILIVDKELQSFPWESLPCLRKWPVSRMPSLGAIKERLDRIPAQSQAYTVARSGSYILNPSNDLPSTQATFSPLLEQLPFQAVVGEPPSEPDFERLLSESPLLLYFGHGSGTQYIRGRTIRKLSQCAVTWLMGCSSAKLTECGIYESYGVPWHYMHGGSPAVVGTLWDVTDRDIDRFAVKGLGEWGLLDVSGVEDKFWGTGKSKTKGKGKETARQKAVEDAEAQRREPVALDEAVAKARDACLLKYLNGAAPVVYGIPVVLE
ncbi:uncharacterized protein HMPREF1541_07951 [Cyphellophora europaea CBS 101466]|uniref:separase n=1 Tax=Cyphellophora europaea (strain CBS 101466) TaxID=1220924 RepID=W2RMP2_CYPE1|nr:uncharacterized protein HMPREF1541_07951 [Cyphellophora europaea CBS 101466]ETN36963.1 hypothetical protein HMPREF1541_07951 [Cyphellophora europaea CBS 101466]